MKFIDKEHNAEIDPSTICIVVKNVSYRKDCGHYNGTFVVYDTEYFSGEITDIMYKLTDGNSICRKITNDNLSLFIKEFIRDQNKFDITKEMIDDSKTMGPIRIDGISKIVKL